MTFLLTNDDGIEAAGLAALRDVVGRRGTVAVVAPLIEQSGMSHRVTDNQPIPVRPYSDNEHAIEGTPVDCARIGVTRLSPSVEWLLSGINAGGNLGSDIYMSGTVAAAREAALLGVRAVAFSQYHCSPKISIDWERSKTSVERALDALLSQDLGPGEFWNVNFPDPDTSVANPDLVFCPVDPGHHDLRYEQTEAGLVYRGRYQDRHRKSGCDVDVCFSGNIAVSRVTTP